MNIEISARGFSLPDTAQHYLKENLTWSFYPAREKLKKLHLRLTKDEATSDNDLAKCELQAVMDGVPSVISEVYALNPHIAANKAINHATKTAMDRIRD